RAGRAARAKPYLLDAVAIAACSGGYGARRSDVWRGAGPIRAVLCRAGDVCVLAGSDTWRYAADRVDWRAAGAVQRVLHAVLDDDRHVCSLRAGGRAGNRGERIRTRSPGGEMVSRGGRVGRAGASGAGGWGA